MKKIRRYVLAWTLLVLSIFSLTSCKRNKENVLTMELEQGAAHIELSFDAKGDYITKMTQTGKVDISSLSELQIKVMEDAAKKAEDQLSKIQGVEYSKEVKDGKLTEKIVVNTDKDTLEKVKEAGVLPIQGNSSKLSLKKTKEALGKNGWAVKE